MVQGLKDATEDTGFGFIEPIKPAARGRVTEHVRDVLREAIVRLDLKPGGFIDKKALATRLGVSLFPVTEALARLAQEGLVEVLPQRGTLVARIRMGDVRQAHFIRRALEAETARLVAPMMTDSTLSALERNLRYQRAAVDGEDREGFHRLDLQFHALLQDALGFGRVREAVETSRLGLERVRRMLSSPRRHAVTYEEHAAILAALAQRDGMAAARAMEHHLDGVIAELLAFAADNPDLVED
jgi:GntR family transcriptional regulator, rspAB operon transcriptional repressor